MSTLSKSTLLFLLNWLDAQLTVVWVRSGAATEGNTLMARLLELGDATFLTTKLAVGALVAYTLYRFSYLPLARRGLSFALGLYLAVMIVHAATGASAAGWEPPERLIAVISYLPDSLVALLS